MKTSDLDFIYPEELVATEPRRPSRVLWTDPTPSEVSLADLCAEIPAGDLLVLNDTKVLKRRVFSGDLEILFLASADRKTWDVLFPSKSLKVGTVLPLPEGRSFRLLKKGRPQTVETDQPLDEDYFRRVGELPLPPYIQKARDQRHTVANDETWYQTAWAEKPGSFAAPTASLHFSAEDLQAMKSRGVQIGTVTLHVGLGTFLPVVVDDLDQHEMHFEWAELSPTLWSAIVATRARGGKVWALGTTVTRTLESAACGKLKPDGHGGFQGFTDLLIQPGYQWLVVDRLLTNFHQPKSTLLALVASFAGLEHVKSCYQWAIQNRFRLFSYGDLSVWIR